jgi:hypothetical protein
MHRHLSFRRFVLACPLALVPLAARAQVMTSEGSPPRWFASAGTGIQWGAYVVDDASASTWDFDAGFPLRGTLEREFSARYSIGVAFSYARLPLNYLSNGSGSACASRCPADATVSSYGVVGRMGGGPGFHQVIEVFLGAIRYGNFEVTNPRSTLPPQSNTDFAFGAGYGFGYSFGGAWEVQLTQENMNSVHERSTLTGAGRIANHYSTRIGVRVGF